MKKKTRTDVIFVCVILALVLVILYSGLRILESTVFYGRNQETLQTESKTITRNRVKYFPRQDITVLMLLGIGWDGEATAKEMNHGGAVDMAALMIFDPKTEKCDILTLNRDMMVSMPIINNSGKEDGVFYGQLAYSHTYGTGMEDSCENTRKTISNLLYGLNIDHYFAINMDAIGMTLDGNFYIVIDKKRDSILLAQSRDFHSFLQKSFLVQFLFPELNTGCTAFQSGLDLFV